MTKQDIRETVKRMQFTDETERAKLLTLALEGAPGARFVVYAAWKKFGYASVSETMRRHRLGCRCGSEYQSCASL